MIALIDNQFYDLTPMPAPDGDYSLRLTDDMVMEVYKGTKRIDFGVIFHTWAKNADIHPKTGKITVKAVESFTIRAIIGDFHIDQRVSPEPYSADRPNPEPDPLPDLA